MKFLTITDETQEEFKLMAETLMNDYAIQTHDAVYRIAELEIYWTSLTHPDESVYPRKHVDPKTGDWFFHYSGVDIALKCEANDGFGGILLRSVYNITKDELIKGPMVCAMKLFSGTNAFEESIKTRLIPYDLKKIKISNGPRVGLGNNAIKHGAINYPYRFYAESLLNRNPQNDTGQ